MSKHIGQYVGYVSLAPPPIKFLGGPKMFGGSWRSEKNFVPKNKSVPTMSNRGQKVQKWPFLKIIQYGHMIPQNDRIDERIMNLVPFFL